MPTTLTDDAIRDLVLTTLEQFGPPTFQAISQELPNYVVMSRILRKDKIGFSDGKSINRRLLTGRSNVAKHVGLNEPDTVNMIDLLQDISIPWKHAVTNWGYLRHEILVNRGASQITDLIEARRMDAMLSLADELEKAFFMPPDPSNKLMPWSLPYWTVFNASEDGFTGQNPTGYTDVAGLDSTDSKFSAWRNYSSRYTNANKTDLFKKMRKAFKVTNWVNPIRHSDYRRGSRRFSIMMNEDTQSKFEDAGEAQNENLGRDIVSYDGKMIFRGAPVEWVPFLDDNLHLVDPVYMTDMSTFMPFFLEGNFMHETGPERSATQHNSWAVFIDLTYNYMCVDRRRNAVFAKVS